MALAQGVELGEKGRTVRGEQGRRVFGRNQQVEIGAPAEIVQDDPVGRSGGESRERAQVLHHFGAVGERLQLTGISRFHLGI